MRFSRLIVVGGLLALSAACGSSTPEAPEETPTAAAKKGQKAKKTKKAKPAARPGAGKKVAKKAGAANPEEGKKKSKCNAISNHMIYLGKNGVNVIGEDDLMADLPAGERAKAWWTAMGQSCLADDQTAEHSDALKCLLSARDQAAFDACAQADTGKAFLAWSHDLAAAGAPKAAE